MCVVRRRLSSHPHDLPSPLSAPPHHTPVADPTRPPCRGVCTRLPVTSARGVVRREGHPSLPLHHETTKQTAGVGPVAESARQQAHRLTPAWNKEQCAPRSMRLECPVPGLEGEGQKTTLRALCEAFPPLLPHSLSAEGWRQHPPIRGSHGGWRVRAFLPAPARTALRRARRSALRAPPPCAQSAAGAKQPLPQNACAGGRDCRILKTARAEQKHHTVARSGWRG